MNYRHAYHAGNFADVMKHAALALLIEYLKRKDAPFCVIDAHAGTGRYDLAGIEAGKTGEYQDGIARLLDAPTTPELAPYLDMVRAMNPGPLRVYPGSPLLARRLMRAQDRLELSELHPEDFQALSGQFAGDGQVRCRNDDAYAMLKAALPPGERRGLVLIDPPYEEKDEYERLLRGLRHALKRWPTGIYVVWYPIKDRPPIARFHEHLVELGPAKLLAAELLVLPDDTPFRLNGCGLAIINPPWQFDDALERLLPDILARLERRQGSSSVRWLVNPS